MHLLHEDYLKTRVTSKSIPINKNDANRNYQREETFVKPKNSIRSSQCRRRRSSVWKSEVENSL